MKLEIESDMYATFSYGYGSKNFMSFTLSTTDEITVKYIIELISFFVNYLKDRVE